MHHKIHNKLEFIALDKIREKVNPFWPKQVSVIYVHYNN